MNRRIQQFLVAENISQAQFADTINVARATVSHVLAGRNKPGFDFIESISHHYPNLNIEWLITGKGKMYKNSNAEIQSELFANEFLPEPEPVPVHAPIKEEPAITSEIAAADSALRRAVEKKKQSTTEKKIAKIIVLYDDNTFTELK